MNKQMINTIEDCVVGLCPRPDQTSTRVDVIVDMFERYHKIQVSDMYRALILDRVNARMAL